MRGHTITEQRSLVTEVCINCGVLFALDSDYRTERRRDHRNFYCPNGHPQHYVDKSDADKLREAEVRIARLDRRLANVDEDLRSERASHRATAGHLTRAKKQLARVDKGVCPHCHRHFVNVERHMQSKHSDG